MLPYKEVRYKTDEDWVAARKNGVGGSDVSAIMGINPYKSPLEVWLEKTGREEVPDLSGKQSVEWGTRLEPLIADKFAEMHPELNVTRKNCTMVSRERPWAFANIDRAIKSAEGRGVLEIKTAGIRRSGDWVFGVPAYYEAQIQHYLSVTGWDFAWCAVLIGGQDYREFYIARDDEDISAINTAVDVFWNEFVQADAMPKLTGKGNESKALTDMFPKHDGQYVSTTDIDFPELGERASLGLEMNALKARQKELDAIIKARIGESKGIESESVRCTWVRSKRRKFNEKQFEEEHPDLYDQYEREVIWDGGLRLSPSKE